MANTRIGQFSFIGGEVGPEMYGRFDDAKRQAGLAECLNFIVKPQGGIENRPGFAFVRQAKNGTANVVRLIPFTFSTTQTVVIELGVGYFRFHTQGATIMSGVVPYEVANSYTDADIFDIHYVQSADVLTLVHPNYPPMELRRLGATSWTFQQVSLIAPLAPLAGLGVTPTGTGTLTYKYVVTTIASDGVSESPASSVVACTNNLFTTGNYNTIGWTAVIGASRYAVYKLSGGMYGYIGQTTTTSLVDDNIAADLSKTPPVYDSVFAATGDYPAAVSYFEQRRCFAGTTNKPANIWMSRSGTESIFNYSLPIRDDDRIAFRVAAREANTIRHIVPLTQLLLLTSSAEWRVTSINSDAITPSNISVRPQSYVGANNVQPEVINNTCLYVAARGGHVRELAYNWQANGFITGDLSLRAPHLFDNMDIVDIAYSKAPEPIVWFVSSSGTLLGMTYIPEQQVGAWHQHTTVGGKFESCCVVAEGSEDVLYCVVNRGSQRTIERMATRQIVDLPSAFFVDSGVTFQKSGTFVRSGSTDCIVAMPNHGLTAGNTYTFTRLTGNGDLPAGAGVSSPAVQTPEWAQYPVKSVTDASSFVLTLPPRTGVDPLSGILMQGVTQVTGLTWLANQTVAVLADGAVLPTNLVVNPIGTLDLPVTCGRLQIGLPITARATTLPIAAQIDNAGGQGRVKNINKAWVRVINASGIWVGPQGGTLTEYRQRTTEPYGAVPKLVTSEIEIVPLPSWGAGGQLQFEQRAPIPMTITGYTAEVSVGG